ncbi:SH3 domain-containing protein [Hirschia litorea]|uniref:SH3 domain-containing protein n=1 Tax=Hirschia litorea TaxID=1199156 RepID=A0ABW2IMB8_9PROT
MFSSQNAHFRCFITVTLLLLTCQFSHGLTTKAYAQAHDEDEFQIESASLTPYIHQEQNRRISKFSSMPVPRYASLKYGEVNGRLGPSIDYPIKWQYQRSGLPVLVIRESGDWRKIRDPQGDEVWVHERMLGARRTGITSEMLVMFQKPDQETRPIAEVSMGVVADIAECEGDWCRIDIDGKRGWATRNSIWGVDDLG